MAVSVGQRVGVQVDDGALALLLAVVYPPDDGDEIVLDDALDEPVLAVEGDGLRIVAAEEVEGMHDGVAVAEEPEDAALLVGGDGGKAMGGDVGILLDQRFGHHHLHFSVLARVLVHLFAGHAALRRALAHLEGRIDEDAVVTIEHLGVHAAH